jgi:hypothetical protein
VRAKVELTIGVVKRLFGFVEVRYRGLKKNAYSLLVTCALANLFMARRRLLRFEVRKMSCPCYQPLRNYKCRTNSGDTVTPYTVTGCCNFNSGHPLAVLVQTFL